MIRTPVQAPNANAHMERWVGSARRELLDRDPGRRPPPPRPRPSRLRAALQPTTAAPRARPASARPDQRSRARERVDHVTHGGAATRPPRRTHPRVPTRRRHMKPNICTPRAGRRVRIYSVGMWQRLGYAGVGRTRRRNSGRRHGCDVQPQSSEQPAALTSRSVVISDGHPMSVVAPK